MLVLIGFVRWWSLDHLGKLKFSFELIQDLLRLGLEYLLMLMPRTTSGYVEPIRNQFMNNSRDTLSVMDGNEFRALEDQFRSGPDAVRNQIMRWRSIAIASNEERTQSDSGYSDFMEVLRERVSAYSQGDNRKLAWTQFHVELHPPGFESP